jgi:uncharacterized protein
MSRLLFWIALAVLVVMAVRSKLRQMSPKSPSPSPDPGRPAERSKADSEKMACCAHCGVYFPASEAVRADGLDYCSPAHVRQPSK